MPGTRFWRRIRNLSAFVIVVLGAPALLGVLFLLGRSWLAERERQRTDGIELVGAPAAPVRAVAGVREVEIIPGTDWLAAKVSLAPANTGLAIAGSPYSGGADHNILLINSRDGSSRALLPDNGRRIWQWHVVAREPGKSKPSAAMSPATGWVMQVDAGTSGAGPRFDIIAGSFASTRHIIIARNVSALDSVTPLADGGAAVIDWENDTAMFRRVDFSTLQVTARREIAIPQTRAK